MQLNSVINLITIYYLSFLNILTMVVKCVTRLQRYFHYRVAGGARKFCWINWKRVC